MRLTQAQDLVVNVLRPWLMVNHVHTVTNVPAVRAVTRYTMQAYWTLLHSNTLMTILLSRNVLVKHTLRAVVFVPQALTVGHLALSVPQTLHPERRNTVTAENGHKYVTLLVFVPTTTWVSLTMNAQPQYLAMDILALLVLLALYVTYGSVPMVLTVEAMTATAEPMVMKLPQLM